MNSLVKIKMIWLYQRVPAIRHGIIDLIFCRITPQIRVPRNRNHFSTEKKRKKEKVEHILLRKSCYIKPLSLVRLLFREIFQINKTELVQPSRVKYYYPMAWRKRVLLIEPRANTKIYIRRISDLIYPRWGVTNI